MTEDTVRIPKSKMIDFMLFAYSEGWKRWNRESYGKVVTPFSGDDALAEQFKAGWLAREQAELRMAQETARELFGEHARYIWNGEMRRL